MLVMMVLSYIRVNGSVSGIIVLGNQCQLRSHSDSKSPSLSLADSPNRLAFTILAPSAAFVPSLQFPSLFSLCSTPDATLRHAVFSRIENPDNAQERSWPHENITFGHASGVEIDRQMICGI